MVAPVIALAGKYVAGKAVEKLADKAVEKVMPSVTDSASGLANEKGGVLDMPTPSAKATSALEPILPSLKQVQSLKM